jgi:peptidoglycan/xylan/chitin deacetylase (PgdA/CDA1 family)
MRKHRLLYLLFIFIFTILAFFTTSCNIVENNDNNNPYIEDEKSPTAGEMIEEDPSPQTLPPIKETLEEEAPQEEPQKSTDTTKNSELSNSQIPPISHSKEKNIPILYYHAVSDDIFGIEELFVSPASFAEQMKYLKDNQYSVITFDQLPEIDKYEKPVIITFDDGYENNYTKAYPILKKYGFPAVIFLTTDYMDKNNYLKKWQIEEMKTLIAFESHTISHPDLTSLSPEALTYELTESNKIIKQLTGRDSIAFAYPFGYYNQTVIDAVKKHYTYAVTITSGLFQPQENAYTIKRVYIPRNTSIQNFETRLQRGFLR